MRLLAAMILLFAAPAHAEEWTTYTDAEAGFSVSYPADWKAEATPMPEAKLTITATGGTAPTTCTFTHTYVQDYDQLTLEMALAGFTEESFHRVVGLKYDDVTVLTRERRRISGREAMYFEAEFRNRADHPDFPGLWINSIVYVTQWGSGPLGAGCDVPARDRISRNKTISRVFDSFRIVDTTSHQGLSTP